MTTTTTTRRSFRSSSLAVAVVLLLLAVTTFLPATVDAQNPILEYQPYVGWLPVIFNLYPQLQSTLGGTVITLVGYRLTGASQGRLPVINVRQASTGTVANCPIVCPNGGSTANDWYPSNGPGCYGNAATLVKCILPAGDGVRYLDYTLFGNSMTQLARWPTDMFFADSQAGASTKCTIVSNSILASGQSAYGWTTSTASSSTNYICAYDTKANWFYQWVENGATPACAADLPNCVNKCISINNTAESTALGTSPWVGRRLCWDSRIPFDLTWYQVGAPSNLACVNWRERSDPYWNNNQMQLCAPLNVPYGGGDSLMYTYAAPVITAVSPLKGETVGGGLLTITGTMLSTSGTITVGGNLCTNPVWPTPTASSANIVCTLPAGEGTVNAVVVTVNGLRNAAAFNFVYNPPFVQSINQPAGASWTGGGYLVTVNGYNFGTTSGTVTIGFSNCPVSTWANKQITCTVPSGMGANWPVYVSTLPPPQVSNTNITFSYTIPTISGINPTTYSTAGGILLTLTGNSFGQAGVVTVGGSSCFTNSWGDQTVICQLPSGAGTSSPLVILVSQLTNIATVYPYKPPSISGVLPNGGSPGGYLTINGDSFGTFSQGVILVNSVACISTLSSYDHTRIICQLPMTPAASVVGAAVAVQVTVSGQVTNPVGTFAYLPIITSFSVFSATLGTARPTSGGVTLSLVGTSFTTSTTTVTVGTASCTNVVSTATSVQCTLPAGQGLGQSIYVYVNGLSNAVASQFNYDPPTLTNISPSSGPSGGGYNVTLVGGNFGLNPVSIPTLVQIGTFVCDVKWQNHTAIICTTRAGSGVSNVVTVTVAGQTTAQQVSFTYFAPTLTKVIPANGPTGGGSIITLIGTGFATTGIVVIGGTVVSTTPFNSTLTTFVLPSGQGITSLYISIDSQASANLPFTYDGPYMNTASPLSGPTEGPVTLIIDGTSFGTGVVITVGGLTCVPTVASQTATHRECTVPLGDGANQPIIMSVGTQTSNTLYYNFNAPSINTISPSATGVTAGGNILTIYGSSFGRTGTVYLGAYQCVTNVAGTSWAHAQIACQVTAGEGANLPIVITVNGQVNAAATYFSYGIPTITSVTPAVGPTVGGTSLLVRGTNFGLTANITIADRPCTVVAGGQSHTQFQCLSPVGQGKNQVVVAKVAGQVSASTTFSYNAPTVSAISPATGPTLGGTIITLTGTNFGVGTAGTVTVTLGTFVASGISVLDTSGQTKILFTLPVGAGASLSTTLVVASQSVTFSTTTFAYTKPTITQVSGCTVNTATATSECPIAGGSLLTLTGANFGADQTKVSVTVGGVACPLQAASLTAHTSVICTLPANANGGYNLAVIITVSSQTGTAALVSYLGPSLTAGTLIQISPQPLPGRRLLAISPPGMLTMNDTVGNIRVRFGGKYFGNTVSAVVVRYGLPTPLLTGSAAFLAKPFVCVVNTVSQDGAGVSSLDCTMPSAMGNRMVFQVQVTTTAPASTQISPEGTDWVTYPAPYIVPSSIRLSYSYLAGGVAVIGANSAGDLVFFDVNYLGPQTSPAVSSLITVKFGYPGQVKDRSCYNPVVGVAASGSGQQWLSCTTEQGLGSGFVFQITANGNSSNQGTDFYSYVTPPSVTSVTGCPIQSPSNINQTAECPTEGAIQLTINGQGFGQQNLSVRVGVNSATNIIYVSPILLYADLPAGTGSPVDVVVSVGQLFSASTSFLYYHAATIDSISGCTTDETSGNSTYNCNRFGGDSITIAGTNFGPADPAATVIVGGKLCTGVVHGASDGSLVHRQLTCKLDTGTLANVPVLVIQGLGVLTTAVPTVSYTLCARGYFALAGVLNCSACDIGTYSDVLGLTSCKQCDSGTFASVTNTTSCASCDAGKYSVRNNGVGPTSCTPCDRGSITSAKGQVACTPCDSGSYNNQTSQSVCTQCSPGYFSTQSLVGSVAYGATICSACASGKYQASSGKSDCDLCPSGTAAPLTNSSACTPCAIGTFSAGGVVSACTPCSTGSYTGTTSSQSCKQCDSGKYAPNTTSSECATCLAGKYSGVGASSCIPCAAKSYTSSDGQPSCTLCSQGLFSNTTGLTVCYACAQGSYAKDAGLTVCAACVAGYYAEVTGSVSCPPCDTGSYSSTGSSTCTKCAAGNFQSTTGQATCVACPKGMAISVSGGAICLDCEPGKYTNITGQSVCTSCLPGSSSSLSATANTDGARGATVCALCDPGKYTSATSAASCDPVPIGHYAASYGQTEADRCAAGTISSAGASVCTNCTRGQYAASTGSAVCSDCPQGSYNQVSGLSECVQCSPGQYQPTSGQAQCFACGAGKITGDYGKTVCTDCSTATFQNATGASVCQTCGVGTYQATTGASTCVSCLPGQYQKSPGSLACDKCRSGYITNYVGASTCDICSAGFYADVGQSVCQDCAAGTSGPVAGLGACEPCDAGKYSPTNQSLSCTDCRKGTVQPNSQQTTCNTCELGKSQASTGQLECNLCGLGYFANVPGFENCEPCQTGRFSDQSGFTACAFCGIGKYQDQQHATTCVACSPGSYTAANGSAICTSCSPGTGAVLAGQVECTPCYASTYAISNGTVVCSACPTGSAPYPTKTQAEIDAMIANAAANNITDLGAIFDSGWLECPACPAGRYQDREGSYICKVCPEGKYTKVQGQFQCTACSAGTYALTNATHGNTICLNCVSGKYQSATGTSTCFDCLVGTYSGTDGQPRCTSCDSGTVAPRNGSTECDKCPPGQHQSAQGQQFCDSCPVGTFTNRDAQPLCQECSAGTRANFPLGGATNCTACEEGYFQASPGSTTCSQCQIGTFTGSPGQDSCATCPAGTYAAINGSTACIPCAAGFQQDAQGQTACYQCTAGTYTNATRQLECTLCGTGTIAPGNASIQCQICPRGSYQPNLGKTACTNCSVGSSAGNPQAEVCTDCTAGYYAATTGLAACVACAKGYAQPYTGKSSCSECPVGKSSPAGNPTCDQCPDRFIAPQAGMDACLVCDAQATSNADFTQCECATGWAARYSNDTVVVAGFDTMFCQECPTGADCAGKGHVWLEMVTIAGYWTANQNFYRCLLITHCDAGSDCGAHRFGVLCTQCIDGYTEGLGGSCTECASSGTSYFTFILVTVLILAAVILQMYVLLRSGRDLIAVAERDEILKEREQAGFVEEYDADWEWRANRYDDKITIYGPPAPKANFTFKLKIALSFAQIVSNLAIGIDIQWPPEFKKFMSWLSPANLDFIQFSSVGCVMSANYYSKMLLVSLLPLAIFAGLFVFYYIPKMYVLRRDSLGKKMVRRKFWKLLLFTLFLIYPSCSSTVLRVFVCRRVEGVDYLLSDFSLECYNAEWRKYAAYAGIMIAVYPIGIPAFFFFMLWRYRHRLEEIGTRAQLGFLYDAYTRDMWWFEMLDVAHKLCVTCIIAFLPYAWQMPIGMVFVIAYTGVILIGKPYLRKSDDRLHLVSQVEILLLLMSGNVFNREVVPDDLMSTVLSVVLIAAVLVFFLFFVIQAVQAGLKLISSFRKANAAQKLKLEGEMDAGTTPERDEEGNVVVAAKPSRMDKTMLKMADELEKFKKKEDHHPEFTISRRTLRPMSRQHGEELRNFHMKANPLFEGHTALYDPTDKDNIVDDIKVNPLYAAKMRRELDEEDNSARSHLSPKAHTRTPSDLSRLKMEFATVRGQGVIQEVAEDGKVIHDGPRRDDDDDVSPRGLDSVEMSVFKPAAATPAVVAPGGPGSAQSSPLQPHGSLQIAPTAAVADPATGAAAVSPTIAGPTGDGPASPLGQVAPEEVKKSGTDAFDDDGPRKPRANRGFDEDDDAPRKRNVD